jgi:hypothetical protein
VFSDSYKQRLERDAKRLLRETQRNNDGVDGTTMPERWCLLICAVSQLHAESTTATGAHDSDTDMETDRLLGLAAGGSKSPPNENGRAHAVGSDDQTTGVGGDEKKAKKK